MQLLAAIEQGLLPDGRLEPPLSTTIYSAETGTSLTDESSDHNTVFRIVTSNSNGKPEMLTNYLFKFDMVSFSFLF